ncbi:response regulator transcription factor [Kineosporia sp. J2-2]|uniref:Response regulator transcription factor n=1 Tax=Kineosporia corallincola TaxID=2835133 RepID=A0ABS5TBB8_9ACTN|nr:response regulator transcription factor [Kineosporia corallincola]MBT0768378.1 response regulator transcription factor [Kineosporia corallincola]
MTIRVAVVDDNPMVRAGLRAMLELDGMSVVAEAADGNAALDAARAYHPDVTLLDYRMPVADGLSVLPRLADLTRVLLLTSDDSHEVITGALAQGASGFLTHTTLEAGELLSAVRAVAAGQGWLAPVAAAVAVRQLRERAERESAARIRFDLTRRERELMDLLVRGLTNAQIAAQLVLSEKTVKNHLNHVYAKLGVGHRTQAVARWQGRA